MLTFYVLCSTAGVVVMIIISSIKLLLSCSVVQVMECTREAWTLHSSSWTRESGYMCSQKVQLNKKCTPQVVLYHRASPRKKQNGSYKTLICRLISLSKTTRLALCQYTWPQYVHRSENHLNQNRSTKVRHDVLHLAWTFDPCVNQEI